MTDKLIIKDHILLPQNAEASEQLQDMALHWMLYTRRAQAEVVVPHHSQWPCSDQHPHKATSVTTRADWGCYQHIPHATVIQLLGSWNWHLLLQHKGSLMHRTAGISHTKSLLFSLFGQSRQVLISWLPKCNKKPLFVLTFPYLITEGKSSHYHLVRMCVGFFCLSICPTPLATFQPQHKLQQNLQWRTWYWSKSDPQTFLFLSFNCVNITRAVEQN